MIFFPLLINNFTLTIALKSRHLLPLPSCLFHPPYSICPPSFLFSFSLTSKKRSNQEEDHNFKAIKITYFKNLYQGILLPLIL